MKAMTLRLPDAMHEALRQRAFNERKSITALVLLAISEMPLVKPARLCDARDCWNEPTRRPTTPGGFHFCDEHRHKGEQEFAREALPAEPEYVGNDRDVLGEDENGFIFAPREGSPDYWERFDRNKPGHLAAWERTKASGRLAFLELEAEES